MGTVILEVTTWDLTPRVVGSFQGGFVEYLAFTYRPGREAKCCRSDTRRGGGFLEKGRVGMAGSVLPGRRPGWRIVTSHDPKMRSFNDLRWAAIIFQCGWLEDHPRTGREVVDNHADRKCPKTWGSCGAPSKLIIMVIVSSLRIGLFLFQMPFLWLIIGGWS